MIGFTGMDGGPPRRRRFLLLLLWCWLLLGQFVTKGDEDGDWSAKCPSKCKCKWASGKKLAECANGGFTTVPSGLSSEVQILDLSGNSIPVLTKDAFKNEGLVNIQKLYMRGCSIESIHRDAFRDLKILIELNLDNNRISSIIMETFETNERLRELYLKGNPLKKLQGVGFPPLNHLFLLDFSDCNLTQFSKKTFEKLINLESLNINGNQFVYLSEDIFKHLTKLKTLDLRNNPWKCDCNLKSFRDWIVARNLYGQNTQNTKCAGPGKMANLMWNQGISSDFACRPEIVTLQIQGQRGTAEDLVVYGDVGRDITLECMIKSDPTPEAYWVRDSQVLANNSRNPDKLYLVHTSNGGDGERWVNLTIVKSEPDDAGEYTCVGRNIGGVVEKNLTLMFQDVPSGAGVAGGGAGGPRRGLFPDHPWIWIVIGVAVSLFSITFIVILLCFCTRKRRVKTARAQDIKNEAKLNGSVAGYTECPTQTSSKTDLLQSSQQQNHHHQQQQQQHNNPMNQLQSVITLSSSSPEGSVQKLHHGHQRGQRLEEFSRRQENTDRGVDGRHGEENIDTPLLSKDDYSTNSIRTTIKTNNVINADDYPDLLDLPRRPQESSPAGSSASTLPDSTRLLIPPQHLNPATLAYMSELQERHAQQQYGIYSQPIYQQIYSTKNPIYSTRNRGPPSVAYRPFGRPSSPFGGSCASYTSEPAVIVPPAHRPGYVTLPRRPRMSSWSPPYNYSYNMGEPLIYSPTPIGTLTPPIKVHPKYDNLGLRRTADGSISSLNKIGGEFGTPSSIRSSMSCRTTPVPFQHQVSLGYYPTSHFTFAPIAEVEGPGCTSNETLPRSWRPSENNYLYQQFGLKKFPPKPPPKPKKSAPSPLPRIQSLERVQEEEKTQQIVETEIQIVENDGGESKISVQTTREEKPVEGIFDGNIRESEIIDVLVIDDGTEV